ncbi:undecaprenyl-diphosphatase [Motilibacter rhizosphaerae]|uniref:Undecaprenyl-diphosphatase n=1 Tax=Motilibacter rhizosphaerae TaxID=598652 RepID=A0A4Q7NAV8_9ACTN|nr:undecaprenyl-diphosphate phosphatase [Motilibacter rhizosphaerae]RZS80049.1 undecaprenyl-diphosphatase [Motilibacter rhizosphaerae]
MSATLSWIDSAVLGVVEGLTEFLPVSSTGHLTVAESILGLKVDDDAITAFTAVIQVGAILAVVLFFRKDIVRMVLAFLRGLRDPSARTDPDWRLAVYVIAGTIPAGVLGLAAKPLVEGPLRSLWVVGISLIVWSGAMWWAERVGRQDRGEQQLTLRDGVVVGVSQLLAVLFPGVSRSGATISTALYLGLDRVAATRLSFFLAIPLLLAAGGLELPKATDVGAGKLLLGTVVSFVVAYAAVAWLLRFVASNSIAKFVPYRVVVGVIVLVSLAAGWLDA